MDVTTIDRAGLPLSVAEAGAGGRPLLLVHGFCGAKEDFTEWLDRLAAAGWHAVAYDQRGHGHSGHPAGEAPFSLSIFADDALAVADELGWQRFVLLGHSMGGMVAQLVALAAPKRLAGLILMDTGHGPVDGFEPDLVEMGRKVVREGGLAALVEAQRAVGPGPLDSAAHLRLCHERAGYREFCDDKTLVASPEMWLAMVGELLDQPDRLAALAGLEMPVLVVVGEQDEGFVGPSRALAAAIPDARLVVVTGGGHSPQFEAPGPWWEAIATFLSGVPE
jgi:pimeloyl-ACP methyl ester carboxylesterase